MNFYQLTIALALLQAGCSPLYTYFTMEKAGVIESILPEERKGFIANLKALSKKNLLIDSMILELHGEQFLLHSADRSKVITEEFLQTCAPDWATRLRNAMEDWSQNMADREVRKNETT